MTRPRIDRPMRGRLRPSAHIVDLAARRKKQRAPILGGGMIAPARKARIYRPGRSVTQAAGGNARKWVLEFEPVERPAVDPLMGWIGSGDTPQQVRLTFATKEQAIGFARRQGWAYTVREPREPKVPTSYAIDDRPDLTLLALSA